MVGAAVRTGLPSAETARFRWERVALVGILVLAALLLALSPITTAISQDNTPDTLLVLLLLLAAYSVTRPVPTGATGWMALAGGFAGMAFLTKMLAGWIVLPGLALAYLAAPVSRAVLIRSCSTPTLRWPPSAATSGSIRSRPWRN
jgi:4-amino-4-deoxy-L-arabinose transferase-like glycosyltransferase